MKEEKMLLIMKHTVCFNLAWQWKYLTDKTGFLFIGTHCIALGAKTNALLVLSWQVCNFLKSWEQEWHLTVVICWINHNDLLQWYISDVYIHWVSKEIYHFFTATLTKILSIKMNHSWTQISYSYPYKHI